MYHQTLTFTSSGNSQPSTPPPCSRASVVSFAFRFIDNRTTYVDSTTLILLHHFIANNYMRLTRSAQRRATVAISCSRLPACIACTVNDVRLFCVRCVPSLCEFRANSMEQLKIRPFHF
ncbi:hypothetical protein Tcan_00939, partial [Toxocara canis]